MALLRRFRSLLFIRQLRPCQPVDGRNFPWKIAKIDRLNANATEMALAGVEIENFEKEADCYVVYQASDIAGSGWAFKKSRLLSKLKIRNAVYLGSFFVNEACRGRGIYRELLEYMCLDCSDQYSLAVAETSGVNAASLRGLENAGFKYEGYLDVLRVLNCINVRCRFVRRSP